MRKRDEVVRMYEMAKKTGEEVPKDVYERRELSQEGLSEGRSIFMMCRFRCSRHGREMGYEAVDTA
jgi:hypothetical protein